MVDEDIPFLDLGFDESLGNLSAADAFLNDSAAVTADADKIVDKNKPEIKETPKETPKEESKEDLVNSFLGDEDNEEEDETPKAEKPKEEEENPIIAFSKELFDLNFFTVGEDEEFEAPETAEDLLSLLNKEKQIGATTWLHNFLSKHGEDRRELFEAIYVDGVDPKDYLPVYNEIESFENLALDNEKNQELIVKTYYKRNGLSDEKIEAKIEKLKSMADLEEEAGTFHPILINQDKQRLEDLRESKVQEQQRIQAQEQEYTNSISKVLQDKVKEKQFDGLPLDEKEAKKAFDFLNTKRYKTPDGQLLTEFDKFILESKKPENIATRTKIALLALNNFDFTKIQKAAVSKESNKLFSSLSTQKIKKSNTQPVKTSSPW